jgi:PadR family transcriptional regulator PadR
MRQPKMTSATQQVLRALLEDPTREMYGLEVSNTVGLAPGTVHPILTRFEGLGWLESTFEARDPKEIGRPRRRYYKLTPHGAQDARNALVRSEQRRGSGIRFRLVPGESC